MDVTVREATSAEDRRAVYRLRHEIYVDELHFHFDAPDGLLRDELDDDAVLFLACADDEPVGTGRLVCGVRQAFTAHQYALHDIDRFLAVATPAEIVIGERLMVRERFRGGAAPLLIMQQVLQRALSLGASICLLDAQPHLVLGYQRLGFRPYLSPMASELGVVVPLAGLAQDADYLRGIGSPMADAVTSMTAPASPARVAALRACFPDHPPVRTEITHGAAYRAEVAQALERLGTLAFGAEVHADPLLAASLIMEVPASMPLILPGMQQQTIYLVLEGHVEAWDRGRRIGMSGPGSFTGDVAFLLARARMSEVRSGSDGVRLLGFSVASLRHAIESPVAAAAFYRALAMDLARKLLERQADAAAQASGAPATPTREG